MQIIHNALKLQSFETLYQCADANARIAGLFAELLEQQFPIETPAQQFTMRNAKDYAAKLNIHTNHLNQLSKQLPAKPPASILRNA